MPLAIPQKDIQQDVQIDVGAGVIEGTLDLPPSAVGLVLFAHGSGSGRHSPRNRFVAESLRSRGLGTLLFDLLTPREEQVDAVTAEHRFDIGLLAERLVIATDWAFDNRATAHLAIGYFGASTGAAAALIAATQRSGIAAIVSRGGRPDLADDVLPQVRTPTLLIVGERDEQVVQMNRQAFGRLHHSEPKEMVVVPGATHLFEEPGALEKVACLAGDWFLRFLDAHKAPREPHEG